MLHIRKIKTMYGLRYAVVDLFTHYAVKLDKFGKSVKKNGKVEYDKKQTYHAVDYSGGVAIFPVTSNGLLQAKAVQKSVKAGAKK
ncbi:hypothetical protein ABNX05_18115 [Lysinibacillus sp. M3]|uniref:Transposase n=1 Tax=Lysinibacillus zambalensis TaxID=3160866 RepID=A0ABV1MVL5_9BACI